MAQIGFYHDMTRCVDCKACQMACKDKNDLDQGIIYRHAESFETGAFPKPASYCYSFSCNHCALPACFAACPDEAISKMEDGTVIIDEGLCTGCKECITACPYGIPQYNEATNTVGKCDGCYDLRQEGEEASCVGICPSRALHLGDMEELQAEFGSGKELTNDFPALGVSPETTQPSLLVNIKDAAKEATFSPSLF